MLMGLRRTGGEGVQAVRRAGRAFLASRLSPDYNLRREEALSKIKTLLREAASRTKKALLEEIARGRSVVTSRRRRAGSPTADICLRLNPCEDRCQVCYAQCSLSRIRVFKTIEPNQRW